MKGILGMEMTKNLWEHDSYPIRKKWDGCDEKYSSITEFKQHLTADFLSSEKISDRWVFWTPDRREYFSSHESDNIPESSDVFIKRIPEKITHVLRKIISECLFPKNILVQFWTPGKVGGRCCLTTLQQPFAVGGDLPKGVSWLRKKCTQHYYLADNTADEDQLGPPGRVFLSGNPESSPDILLYSTKEFPLRDLVAGCGLKSYLALPIFDVHHNQCVGVLEFIHESDTDYLLNYCSVTVYDALQEVGMRSAHKKTSQDILIGQPCEIEEMLDLAIASIPQLLLAQVWVPCKQCANNSSSINCMERATFTKDASSSPYQFVSGCGFHNIQSGQGIVGFALSSTNKWCFCENLSTFSISEYPMKHYAQRESLSSCFAICLRSKDNGNDLSVFEFFLQPHSRDVASIQSILHLLLKIMEKKLKRFEIATEQYLGVEYQQLEEHILAIPKKKYMATFSVSEFQEFFPTMDLYCLKTPWERVNGRVCWRMKRKELTENKCNDSSMCQLNLGTEAIKLLFFEILSIGTSNHPFLIQFWEPKITGNKSFLSTSEQLFALPHLQKGLCLYRKQCMENDYYICDGAKEDELGPPARVFLSGHPESSPDLRLYSEREFPLRDHVVNSGARTYLALPLFHLFDKQCVGVLEFVGFPYIWEQILRNLQKCNLRSTHIRNPSSIPIDEGKKQALSEIDDMLALVIKSPQLQTALAWISCSQCAHSNIQISCMELATFPYASLDDFYCDRIDEFINCCEFHQLQTRKGIIGKVIESESKLYFCENLCSLSICEQPLAHYAQLARLEICFAICLKSSYTGNSLYVIEFFLSPHSNKYEYSRTLCFLLSIMKQMLKSFKVASGQQLGEELVSEVRELCHGMEHHLSKHVVHFESDGVDSSTHIVDVNQNIIGFSTTNQLTAEMLEGQCSLPLGFENVQSGHETEHQYSKNQIHFSGMDDASNIDQEQEQNIADATNVEGEAQNITDVNFEEGNEGDRSSTSFHVSYEQLKSQFGMSRKDAAKNLGVSISTFKRKCREYEITRWPSKMNNIKNPSLFRTKVAKKCVENADHQASKPSGCDITTSDFPVEPNISSPPIPNTMEHANTCQAADVVIKTKFKDDILKFEFHVSWGVEKLMEEVNKRLDLKIGEFKLKYVDDDDDLILLKCDEDLHFFVKSMKSLGKTTVEVLVHLIS